MALIAGMFDSGALPVAERLVAFTGRRHQVLTHNIANLSTPFFKPQDVDSKSFQAALSDAVDRRRATSSPIRGALQLENSRQLRFTRDGVELRPHPTNENILFHDQNNRDLERTMQNLAENTMANQLGIELVRNQFDMLRLAIRERI